MELNRRDLLKAAALTGAAALTTGMVSGANAAEAAEPVTMAAFNAKMRESLRMDCDCIGIKFYESIDDVPDYAIRPVRDMGKHMSTCQAFSLARYNSKTICMTAVDEWCWAPLVGYGIVDCSEGTESFNTIIKFLSIPDMEKATRFYADQYPRLPLYKYEAWVIGPLSKIDYDPDVVMIYGDPFKINSLFMQAKHLDAKTISSNFDGIDSCVYELVNTMTREDYQVAFPDPGEIVRARTKQTDAVFCVPNKKLQEFMECMMTTSFNFEIQFEYPLDYSRPGFYNDVFAMWGLEVGKEWEFGSSKK